MTPAEHAEVKAVAEQRGPNVSALVRSLIEQELATRPMRERPMQEALDQILFLPVMIDGVFAKREPDCRRSGTASGVIA